MIYYHSHQHSISCLDQSKHQLIARASDSGARALSIRRRIRSMSSDDKTPSDSRTLRAIPMDIEPGGSLEAFKCRIWSSDKR